MGEILTKEKAAELMKMPGEVRGVCLKVDMEFIKKELGEDGLKKMEDELEKVGCPIKYKEINIGGFYPMGQDIVDMWIIWQIFNFNDKKMIEIGYEAPKFSIFLKVFLKYFSSVKDTIKEAPGLYQHHYTTGEMDLPTIDEVNKTATIVMRNTGFHPIFCLTCMGYFTRILEMLVNGKVECQEVKCTFRGDDCHEFLLHWTN